MSERDVSASDSLIRELSLDASKSGYRINPDESFVRDLAFGLLTNEERFGYRSCPCRLASGIEEEDRDIICPCDYRDSDIAEHGACYCALYVSGDVAEGRRPLLPVPERRRSEGRSVEKGPSAPKSRQLAYPVWRCKVCGYLAARDEPPEVCPICKAKKDRFERFM